MNYPAPAKLLEDYSCVPDSRQDQQKNHPAEPRPKLLTPRTHEGKKKWVFETTPFGWIFTQYQVTGTTLRNLVISAVLF